MNKKIMIRSLSMLLAVVIAFLAIPLSPIIAYAVADETITEEQNNVTNYEETPEKRLGLGFNALTESGVTADTLKDRSWLNYDIALNNIVVDPSSTTCNGESYYTSSSLDMLTHLGVDYSRTDSVTFPIYCVKANVTNKFSIGIDLNLENTFDESYYYYYCKAKTCSYGLADDYYRYLSDDFLNAVRAIRPESDLSIKAFFDTYGTHMLTGFDMGGELQLSAWAISTSSSVAISAEIKNSMGVKAEVVSDKVIGGETVNEVALAVGNETIAGKYESGVRFNAYGGVMFVDTTDPTQMKINVDNIEKWIYELPEHPAYLPDSSEFVAVWEVLPSTAEFEAVRMALYEYFLENMAGVNDAFLKKYCSFNDRVILEGYTYISPDGYVSQNVPYEIKSVNNSIAENCVAPGSTVAVSKYVEDSVMMDLTEVRYVIDEDNTTAPVTVNQNGAIVIGEDAIEGEYLRVNMMSGDLIIARIDFVVMPEGNNLFFGGYGTSARPYLISTPEHLILLANNSTLAGDATINYRLVSDIDMTGWSFNGISNFAGTFDGNNHSIYGFNISKATRSGAGFFVKNSGTIKNLTLGSHDGSISSSVYNKTNDSKKDTWTTVLVGGIAANNTGIIDNCTVRNLKITGILNEEGNYDNTAESLVGAIAGSNPGKILRCNSYGNNIRSTMEAYTDSGDNNYAYVGGITASNNGTIDYAVSSNNTLYAWAEGNGEADWSGTKTKNPAYVQALAAGIAAYATGESIIKNSIAYSNSIDAVKSIVNHGSGDVYEGAIVGNAAAGSLQNCYAYNPNYSVVHTGSSTGAIKCASMDALARLILSNEYYYFEATTETDSNAVTSVDVIRTNPLYSITVSPGITEYIQGDNLNLIDTVVSGNVLSGGLSVVDNLLVKTDYTVLPFKQYFTNDDNVTGYHVVDYEQFKVDYVSIDGNNNFVVLEEPFSETVGNKTLRFSGCGLNLYDTYNVEVIAVSTDGIVVIGKPNKIVFYQGDEFKHTGISLLQSYNNGQVRVVDKSSDDYSEIMFSGYDPYTLGNQEITVSLGGYSTSYEIFVCAVKPKSIEINTLPDKVSYSIGDIFDCEGLTLLVKYNNGTEAVVTEGFFVDGFDSSSEGNYDLKVSYPFYDVELEESIELYTAFAVNVGAVSSIKIIAAPEKCEYYTSAVKPDTTGLALEVTYSNGVVKTVTSGFTTYGYNFSNIGSQEVVVNYGGFEDSYIIRVDEVRVESVSIEALPKTVYYVEDTFTISGLLLELTHNDGSVKSGVYTGMTAMVEGYDVGVYPTFNTTGNKTVTIYYTEGEQQKTVQYNIEILPVEIVRIELHDNPYKMIYKERDEFNPEGMVVNAVWNNGKIEALTDYTYSYDFTEAGTATVTIWHRGYQTTVDVSVVEPERIVISSLPDVTMYMVGDKLDVTGIEISAVYYDRTHISVPLDECEISCDEFTEEGTYSVQVMYDDLSAEYTVTVVPYEIPDGATQLVVESKQAIIGQFLYVDITLVNNPGITSMKLNVEYDSEILIFKSVEYNPALGGMMNQSKEGDSPIVLNWFNGTENIEGDIVFATLCFEVSDNATVGNTTSINVTYNPEDVFTLEEVNVEFIVVDGEYVLIDYVPGDMNGDSTINNKDLSRLFQHLSGWDVEVNEAALDINGDGSVNNKDLSRLFQYLSGWDVELY